MESKPKSKHVLVTLYASGQQNRKSYKGYGTLLLIKLWRAMTLRMREERYITNIMSFVFTAKRREIYIRTPNLNQKCHPKH